MTRPARVVIDLKALRSNLQIVRKHAPNQKVMAIIKADAYGHGLERVANQLDDADAFGVACLEEAVRLRTAGFTKPIILLEGFFSADELDQFSELNLQTVIHQNNQLELIEQLPADKAVNVWLKIDTGMHRLGFDLDLVSAVYNRLKKAKGVDQIKLVTHFASSQADSMESQLTNFFEVVSDLEGEHCLANSGAVIDWPAAHGDWIRPGLMLYGVSPFTDQTGADLGLKPAMSLHSELISVKLAKKGEKVGYGGTWECPEDMPIGVIAMGYGDGYPRHACSGTPMLVNNQTASLIGRPSMDMLTVDLRQCPDAKIGDPVLLWGEDLPVEEIARCAETIPYELLCGMRMRARFVEING
ncbi:MAG: alanine racemase [Gammaproteobacteria bacterium]